MFQSALIQSEGTGHTDIDAGVLAETLLFYNKTHIVAKERLLRRLLVVIPPQDFLDLMRSETITLSYSSSLHAVLSEKTRTRTPKHTFGAYRIARGPQGKNVTNEDVIKSIITAAMGHSHTAHKIADQIIERTRFVNDELSARQATALTHSELDDRHYRQSAIENLMYQLVPSYQLPRNWTFKPRYIGGSFMINTNLDFEQINKEYYKDAPTTHSPITVRTLLMYLFSARMQGKIAAEYMSEIITKDPVSSLIRIRMESILRRRDINLGQIDIFQESVLNDCRKIREAINVGERSFSEFMRVLEKAARFKNWLTDQNPDANIITEYYRSVTAEGPMSKLPVKIMRYVTTSLVGLSHPVSGLALSAADQFLLDGLFKGWRPNHFVDGPLRKFVGKS